MLNGDRNTRTFHTHASRRKRKNEIKELEDGNETLQYGEEAKAEIIQQFFQTLFTTNSPQAEAIARVTAVVQERVNDDDFEMLNRESTAQEVKTAVFDMHPSKAPGPDGFNERFFQFFCPGIGEEVTERVLKVLNGDDDVGQWNSILGYV